MRRRGAKRRESSLAVPLSGLFAPFGPFQKGQVLCVINAGGEKRIFRLRAGVRKTASVPAVMSAGTVLA